MRRIMARRIMTGWVAVAVALAVLPSAADEEARTGESRKAPAEASSPEAGAEPEEAEQERADDAVFGVYVPPSRGAARVRTGGGTRGVGSLSLSVLAPDHVGLTTRAQPSLGWFASEDVAGRVDFTLIRDGEVDPLVEVTLEGPHPAGIHFVDLADVGVELEPGSAYEWSVALVNDPEQRDLDVVAGGVARLAAEDVPPRDETPSYRAFARHGVWYDAIADLSAAIAARPGDAALRRERAELLEQVGLEAVADYDRAEAVDATSGPEG